MNFITLDGIVYNCDHIRSVQHSATGLTVYFVDKSCVYIADFDAEEDSKYYFEQLQKQLTGFVGDRSVEWREHAKRKREAITSTLTER